LQKHGYLNGFDFIDQVFDELQLDYLVRHDEIKNIPVTGRVLIVANHPLGGLDGLALLRLIGKTRRDVSIIVNELLCNINSLNSMFLPVDTFGGETHKADLERIITALNQDRAVIIFPLVRCRGQGQKAFVMANGYRGFYALPKRHQRPFCQSISSAKFGSFLSCCEAKRDIIHADAAA
jgi:1-acyl-sn-glycerol-3-phosphate acyltransferase